MAGGSLKLLLGFLLSFLLMWISCLFAPAPRRLGASVAPTANFAHQCIARTQATVPRETTNAPETNYSQAGDPARAKSSAPLLLHASRSAQVRPRSSHLKIPLQPVLRQNTALCLRWKNGREGPR
jgi:hypothetical protein